MSTSETIVAAAIRIPVSEDLRETMWNGRRVYPDYLTVSSPPPARHHTLLQSVCETYEIDLDDQGFITSQGRFVDRAEAKKIAISAGQTIIKHESYSDYDHWLYSEDLW